MANHAIVDIVTIRVDRFRHWLPQLVTAVAEIGGVAPEVLVGPNRSGWPFTLRQVVVLAAIDVLGKSRAEIGRQLGGRDHSTICGTYAQAQRRMSSDGEFRQLATLVLAVARAINGRNIDLPTVEPELPL